MLSYARSHACSYNVLSYTLWTLKFQPQRFVILKVQISCSAFQTLKCSLRGSRSKCGQMLCMERRGMLSWSQRCLRQHWKLAGCIANLPSDRWVQRISQWCPVGRRSSGRLPYTWTSVLESFCRYKQLGTWTAAAQNTNSWMSHMDEIIKFCSSRDSWPDP